MFNTKVNKLLAAAKNGDLEAVKLCIEHDKTDVNASLKATSSHELGSVPARTTALMLAAKHARLNVVEYLISLPGCMSTLRNEEGLTAFIYALTTNEDFSQAELDQIASILINNKADTFVHKLPDDDSQQQLLRRQNENYALVYALKKGLTSTAELLIQTGISLDVKLSINVHRLFKYDSAIRMDVPALFLAIKGSHAQCVSDLLAQSLKSKHEICNLGAEHGFNYTIDALDLAAQTSSFAVLKLVYDHYKAQEKFVSVHRLLNFLLLRGSIKTSPSYFGFPATYDFNIVKQFIDMLPTAELQKTLIEPPEIVQQKIFFLSRKEEVKFNKLEDARLEFKKNLYEGGQTLMFVAAKVGSPECIAYLAEKGLLLNVRDSKARTPMLLAAAHGSLDTVKQIAEMEPNSTNIELTEFERHCHAISPLMAAISAVSSAEPAEREEIAKFLLMRTDNVNATYGKEKRTALTAAAYNCSLNFIQQLLANGARSDVNNSHDGCNWSPLIAAARGGNLEVIPDLIADLEMRCPHNIAEHVNLESVGYTSNIPGDMKATPLVNICAVNHTECSDDLKVKAVASLIKYADLNKLTAENRVLAEGQEARPGKPAIYYAVSTNCPLTTKILIDNGANIEQNNFRFYFELQRNHNWNGDARNKNTLTLSLITLAAVNLNIECLAVLLNTDRLTTEQKKAFINQRVDEFGKQTILMVLANMRKPDALKAAEMLIAAGADLSLICNDGLTALDYAKNTEMAKILKHSVISEHETEAESLGTNVGCCGLGPIIPRRLFRLSLS